MRTIEPSTKGPDDSSGGGAAGGTELFFLLGTSDEGSLRTALLEARELGVDVFLLGVAILAVSLPGCGFRSHLPAAPARRRPTPARTARRASAREPAPAPAQSLPGSVSGHAPPLRPLRLLGDASWREWDAVAHGSPREAATGLLCTFLLFSDFFFNSEKNVTCIECFGSLFSAQGNIHEGRECGTSSSSDCAFNRVPVSKQKPQQSKLSNDCASSSLKTALGSVPLSNRWKDYTAQVFFTTPTTTPAP